VVNFDLFNSYPNNHAHIDNGMLDFANSPFSMRWKINGWEK
jgi:hypothetical protein